MNYQSLGWGWMGTPDGRQQVGKGVSQAANLAHYFDLASELGSCLPTPSPQTLQHPLFCIFYRAQEQVLGIAHYVAVHEFSSTRQGGHLGSFLLCSSNLMPKGQGELVLRLLEGFSKAQYQQVVDVNTCAYKQGVNLYSLPMPEPQEMLKRLEASLTPPSACFTMHDQASKPLVIYYQHARLPQLLNSILEQELFMDFSEVYFTSSLALAKQALANHFTVWSAENLDGAHWEWQHVVKPIATKYAQRLKDWRAQAQSQLEQQRQDFASRLQQRDHDFTQQYNKLKQEVREEIRQYQQLLEAKEQAIAQLQQQRYDSAPPTAPTTASKVAQVEAAQIPQEEALVTQKLTKMQESGFAVEREVLAPESSGMSWKTIILIALFLGVVCVASFALTMLFLL